MENSGTLKSGTKLQGGKYIIEKVIGHGGFGITYLANFSLLHKKVAIKECFISGYCVRQSDTITIGIQSITLSEFSNFKERFLKEAITLARFSMQPNIVNINDVFEENGTAYFVMDYLGTTNLDQFVKQRWKDLSVILKNPDKQFTSAEKEKVESATQEFMNYMAQICEAVAALHAHKEDNKPMPVLHRDIKPANILITEDYKAVLIDFGTAKEAMTGGHTSSIAMLTQGYAPKELYSMQSNKGPYTDIYSLGATLYYCLTGVSPVESIIRDDSYMPLPRKVNPMISLQVQNAIMKAMELKPADRYQTVNDFLSEMLSVSDKIDNVGQNTDNVIKGGAIENYIKEVKGTCTKSDLMYFVTQLEKKYGELDKEKILKYAEGVKTKLFLNKEENAWTDAKKANTVEVYKKFVHSFPDSKYIAEAKSIISSIEKQNEDDFWKKVIDSGKIEDYNMYFSRFPQGKYANESRSKIEEIIWKSALKEKTLVSLGEYLKSYPNGKYVKEAEKEKEAISKNVNEKAAIQWAKIEKRKTITSIRTYLNDFPGIENSSIANEELDKLLKIRSRKRNNILAVFTAVIIIAVVLIIVLRPTEKKAWNKALKENTVESFQIYSDKYYDGLHKNEAIDSINSKIDKDNLVKINDLINEGESLENEGWEKWKDALNKYSEAEKVVLSGQKNPAVERKEAMQVKINQKVADFKTDAKNMEQSMASDDPFLLKLYENILKLTDDEETNTKLNKFKSK